MGLPTSTIPRDTTQVNTDDQEVYSPNFHSDTPAELFLWNQSLPSLLKFMYASMWKYKPRSNKESYYCSFSRIFMLRDWKDGSAGKELASQMSGPEFASLLPIWSRMLLCSLLRGDGRWKQPGRGSCKQYQKTLSTTRWEEMIDTWGCLSHK